MQEIITHKLKTISSHLLKYKMCVCVLGWGSGGGWRPDGRVSFIILEGGHTSSFFQFVLEGKKGCRAELIRLIYVFGKGRGKTQSSYQIITLY